MNRFNYEQAQKDAEELLKKKQKLEEQREQDGMEYDRYTEKELCKEVSL